MSYPGGVPGATPQVAEAEVEVTEPIIGLVGAKQVLPYIHNTVISKPGLFSEKSSV
jgi:hypothetical protein